MAVECVTCNLRAAEGACVVCKTPLCTTCGIQCDRCGSMSCSTHTQWTQSGHALCARCVRGDATQPRQPSTKPSAPMAPDTRPPQQQAPTSPPPAATSAEPVAPLSFEALSKELGEVPAAAPPQEPAPRSPEPMEREAAAEPGAPVHRTGAGYTKGLTAGVHEPNPNRVLTASGQKATPPWLTGLFAAGIAWILLLPLLLSAENIFQQAQPWMSYGIAILGAGTGLWCLSAFLSKETERNERVLCAIGMLLGVAAGFIALAVRSHGGPA